MRTKLEPPQSIFTAANAIPRQLASTDSDSLLAVAQRRPVAAVATKPSSWDQKMASVAGMTPAEFAELKALAQKSASGKAMVELAVALGQPGWQAQRGKRLAAVRAAVAVPLDAALEAAIARFEDGVP